MKNYIYSCWPNLILIAFIILMLNGCAIKEQLKSSGQWSTIQEPEDLLNSCELYIIRSSSIFGAAIRYTVAIDYQDLAVMTVGDSINVKLSPGPHIITAKYPRQLFLGTAESTLEINCQLKTPIYVYMTPGISVGLKKLSIEDGIELYRDSDIIPLE